MFAPETTVEEQVKEHKSPLLIIGGVVAVVLIGLLGLLTNLSDEGGAPEGAEVQIDGRTGAEEPASD